MKPRVLLVDDEPRYRELYARVLRSTGVEVLQASNAEEARQRIERASPAMVISDIRMPGGSGLELLEQTRASGNELPFLLVTAFADVRDAVSALKLGAVDYLAKPVDLSELLACVCDTLGLEAEDGDDEVPAEERAALCATSPAMRSLLRDAWRIADSDVSVLLTGESGTGKELLARFIHRNSPRTRRPFVAINSAAMPANLIASELFGHERGAFTGATSPRRGRFREAEGGVLFLDEIGDMPMELQPVLLRALEQRTITPVGASGDVPVDFRLLAATNRPLEADVAAGTFRADLFYRLNVITLHIAPLRERREDILPLARAFLAASGEGKRITRAAGRLLLAHGWPGNVRELKNAMERAHLLSRTDTIMPESLPPVVRQAADAGSSSTADAQEPSAFQTLKDSEIASLRRALSLTEGNRTKAAELLGITRRGLLKKMQRFGIDGDDP